MRDGGDVVRFSSNYNTSEISCAIGLFLLLTMLSKRRALLDYLANHLNGLTAYLNIMEFPDGSYPFLIPIRFTNQGLQLRSKLYESLENDSIPFAKEYPCFAFDWKCVKQFQKYGDWRDVIPGLNSSIEVDSSNAIRVKAETFNLYLHEGYTFEYMDYVLKSFRRVFAVT